MLSFFKFLKAKFSLERSGLMSKSVEYIKSRIENKDNTNMELSFDNVYEVSPK